MTQRDTAPCAPCAPASPLTPPRPLEERGRSTEAGFGISVGRMFARREIWLSLVLFAVIMLFWEWGLQILKVEPYIFPQISKIWEETVHMWINSQLLDHTWNTCLSVIIGFVLGSLLGAVIGYLFGMSPTAELVASPYILALQIAPKVAFAPLLILWFGYNDVPKILVTVLIVFFPILINVLTALRGVDPAMINLARSFNATRWQIFWKIEFPASMPALFSGLRIGSTLAVIGVTVGEFVGGNTGLGYLLVQGEAGGNAGALFSTIIILTLIGILAYCLVIGAERWVLRYMPKRKFGDVNN